MVGGDRLSAYVVDNKELELSYAVDDKELELIAKEEDLGLRCR
jgi:hypothetical protein